MTPGAAQVPREAVRVGVVSPYPAVRAGLGALLSPEDRLEVVGQAANTTDLLAERLGNLDILLLDLGPEGGVEIVGEAATAWPDAGIVCLGPFAGEARLAGLLAGRPWAYLLNEVGATELARAIEAVDQGMVVLQPPLAGRLLMASPSVTLNEDLAPAQTLTPREHEVLQLVAQGLPNKAIALRLGISEHTVKFHVTSILTKLDATSRTEAVRLGARNGLIVL